MTHKDSEYFNISVDLAVPLANGRLNSKLQILAWFSPHTRKLMLADRHTQQNPLAINPFPFFPKYFQTNQVWS